MSTEIHLNPRLVIEKLQRAVNEHDLEAFVNCFDPLYHTEQPLHPDRIYRGREKVRKEWSETFKRLPDFHAKLIRSAVHHDTVWVEWHWTGTQRDKSRFEMIGVTIFGIRENRITWARAYMEPVQRPGAGLEATAG
ncbi:MAG: nuclear transport factor 2 family protein [Deltaproteobacteria bacterium]